MRLSPRQKQVLLLLLSGLSQKQISYTLERSEKTINTLISTAKKRNGCTTNIELILAAARAGLIGPPHTCCVCGVLRSTNE